MNLFHKLRVVLIKLLGGTLPPEMSPEKSGDETKETVTPSQPAPRRTLSTELPAEDLTQALNRAALLMGHKNKQVMSVEVLLLAFLKMPEVEAHRLLRELSRERGFNWASFERYVERIATERLAGEAQFDFVADNGERIPLGAEMVILLNEGLALANSQDESRCHTAHTLAVMAAAKIEMAQPLNRLGITPQAVSKARGRPGLPGETTAVTHASVAKGGQRPPDRAGLQRCSVGGLKKKPGSPGLLGGIIMANVVTPLGLEEEEEELINTDLQWLFTATDHYLKIQQGVADFTGPVPVDIPAQAQRDQEANNTVIAFETLTFLSPAGAIFEEQIESIIRRINIHLRNLNILLDQQAELGEETGPNVALKHRIKATYEGVVTCTQELAALMQEVYGVRVHSPQKLAKLFD